MSGFVFVMAPCVACKIPFSFHPNKVPSIRIAGVREPVCKRCLDHANEMRRKAGLNPFPILPGAYDAAPEGEVDWNG